jgi:hypothetical protein
MSLLVCSYGGGRNSCAGLIGLRQRNIAPDRIQFSDTGVNDAEKPETYAHIALMSEWCEGHGFPPITTVRVADNPIAVDRSLYAHCLRTGCLPSIAYGFRRCSQRWKADPQRRDLRRWMDEPFHPHDAAVTRAIFYDSGESHRAHGNSGRGGETLWYPLIEWGWDLERCVDEIRLAGLPIPAKSSCFFCPSLKKREVLLLKREHPNLFDRAVRMEQKAFAYHTAVKGLGRRWSWEELGKADEAQLSFFQDSHQDVPCMCFDGDDDEAIA